MPVSKYSKSALEKRTKSQGRQIANLKEKAKKAPMSSALATVGGAAAVGAARAKIGNDVAGMPIEPTGAIAVAAIGFFTGKPFLISFASGWVAPYIADQVEQSLS